MNNLLKNFRQAIRGLTANLTRSGLTTLGIVIGIATVIMVFSIGAGFKSYLTDQIASFGTNTVFIGTRVPPTTKARNSNSLGVSPQDALVTITSFKNRDIESIRRLPNVVQAYGAVTGQKPVSYGNVSKNSIILGADSARFDVDQGKLAAGRFYTDAENTAAAQVAILGADIAKDLFGQNDPLGKMIRVGDYNFLVIGVYQPRGSLGIENDDQEVFVPLVTAQKKLLGVDYLIIGVAQLRDQTLAAATAEDMAAVMRRNHNITDPAKDDFQITTQAQGLDTLDTILGGLQFLLAGIGAISLLVGGVGIMNIMYVVVTERIAEIGLKKALGARNADILAEFLLEALLITLLGGVLGVVLGSLLSFIVAQAAAHFGYAWQFSVPISSIILAVGVSGAIGVGFGVFPARRAARLDPIEALRYE